MATAITNGAELTRKLRESGTGGAKLLVCEAKLNEIDKAEKRPATSDEIIAELEKSFPGSMTVEKARQFADCGEYTPNKIAQPPKPEDKFLGPAPEVTPVVGPVKVGPPELLPEITKLTNGWKELGEDKATLASEKAKFEAEKVKVAEDRAKLDAEAKAFAEEKAKFEAEKIAATAKPADSDATKAPEGDAAAATDKPNKAKPAKS